MILKSRRMRNLIIISISTLILLHIAPLTAVAAQNAKATIINDAIVTVDGVEIELNDPLRMLDGRLFIPVVGIVAVFGATVDWDQDNEQVTIHTSDEDKIVLSNGVPVVYFNDNRYLMDVAPFIEGGRTYLPIRFIAQLMHATVKWYADEQLAELVSLQADEEAIPAISMNEAEPFTEDDLVLLAKITQVETGYETYEGQLAVANVILNRVKDSRFPDSIKEVIYSGKQFPPAHNGLLDKSKPNASVMRAAKDALNGKNNVEDAVYFYNPKVTKGAFWSGLEVITKIGTHRFAK